MQLKIESHFCSLVLKISFYSCSPTTRIPPFLNCHALFVHGSESTKLRLHIVFISDEAGEANSLLKFWAVIPVCFFEFLIDEGISIAGESLHHNLSLWPDSNEFRKRCNHREKPYTNNDRQNLVSSLHRVSSTIHVRRSNRGLPILSPLHLKPWLPHPSRFSKGGHGEPSQRGLSVTASQSAIALVSSDASALTPLLRRWISSFHHFQLLPPSSAVGNSAMPPPLPHAPRTSPPQLQVRGRGIWFTVPTLRNHEGWASPLSGNKCAILAP